MGTVVCSARRRDARVVPLRAREKHWGGAWWTRRGSVSVGREGQRETEGGTLLRSGVNHEVIELHFGSIVRGGGNRTGGREEESPVEG